MNLENVKTRLAKCAGDKLKTNYSLKNLCTFKVGGDADFFVQVDDENLLINLMKSAEELKVDYFLLGSGSNLLIDDAGYRGLILLLKSDSNLEIEILEENKQDCRVRVPGWCLKSRLLEYAYKNEIGGLEFSAGIPGTMGGAMYMNAGTKWGSYADVVVSARFYNVKKKVFTLSKNELGLSYRSSSKNIFDAKTALLSVDLTLPKSNTLSIKEKIEEILCYRGIKQPLDLPNCGSVFKNPPEGKGAGRLIEACSIKGKQIGGAQISLKHANFIVNTGDAKASDIKELISFIQAEVSSRFGIELEREVVYLAKKNS